jgi:hypothetical protein
MTTVYNRLADALASERPFDTLRHAVQALVDRGEPPQRIYDQLEAFALQLRTAGRETDEDTVLDVMDLLVGYCAPDMRIRVPKGEDT